MLIRPWLFQWGELGLIQICGKNAANHDAIVAACKAIAGHPGVVRLQDFVINTDVIVLSTPEIAGLPYVISGLVAAGGLAAALSTADGLLLAIANALSHDIYYKMITPLKSNTRKRHRLMRSVVGISGSGNPSRSSSTGVGCRWARYNGDGCCWAVLRSWARRCSVLGGANEVAKRLIVARVLLCWWRRLRGARLDQTVGHPGDGGLGVLARHGRQLPGARPRHLVETRHRDGSDLRDHRGLGPLPVLSRLHSRYFPQASA